MNDGTRRAAPIALEISSLLVPAPSGIGVFGRSLVERLHVRGRDRPYRLVYRLARHGRRRYHTLRGLPTSPYVWGHLLHRRYPLLHALDTRFPAGYRGCLVATLFDVLSALSISRDQRLSSPRFQARKWRQYQCIARRADAVIAISEETRRRFQDLFDFRREVHVVYPGVNPIFRPAAACQSRLRALGLEENGYLLFVGELCRRKNLEAVERAYRRARENHAGLELVLVGRPSFGWKGSPAHRSILADPTGVRLMGFLSSEDLAAVYGGARAFLFLSRYEGFGLPVLEAMASGVPVIAARRGGIPEATGDAAVLVDPDSPAEVDGALARVLGSPAERERWRSQGLARAAHFSWDRSAEKVEGVYRQVLGQ